MDVKTRTTVVPALDLSAFKPKNTAIYTRVSSDFGTRHNSIVNQEEGLEDYIKSKGPLWNYVGTYVDEGFTGTKDNRPGFQRMLRDARAGKIDRIVVKSMSRFSRNAATILAMIQEFRRIGVEIYFMEEHIKSTDTDCDLMLSLKAVFAEQQAKSASENQLWSIRRKFEKGISTSTIMYGYRSKRNGDFVVVDDEAKIVRMIYDYYLSGMGCSAIAHKLTADGVSQLWGGKAWHPKVIRSILTNEKYTGDLLLQKTFRPDFRTKRSILNTGQKRKYLVQDHHEAIIDCETFNKVQEEIARRGKAYPRVDTKPAHLFTGLIHCGNCGKAIKHKKDKTSAGSIRSLWICHTYLTSGKAACSLKKIPENCLIEATKEALSKSLPKITIPHQLTRSFLQQHIRKIIVNLDNTIEFEFIDNIPNVTVTWALPSRKDSWTPEMKEAARQRALAKRKEACHV